MKAVVKQPIRSLFAVAACLCLCVLLSGCAAEVENKTGLQRSVSSASLVAISEATQQADFPLEEVQGSNADEAQKNAQGQAGRNTEAAQEKQAGSASASTSSKAGISRPASESKEVSVHEHAWVSKNRVISPERSITKKCAKGDTHHTMWVVASSKDGNKEHLYYLESDARAYANQLKAQGYSPTCNSWYRPHYLSGTKSAVIETYEACSCGAEKNHARPGGIETWIDDGSPCEAWWGK